MFITNPMYTPLVLTPRLLVNAIWPTDSCLKILANAAAGLECQVCPCPLTTPSNQFGRECFLDADRQVTCRCASGYTGRRCGECSPGYVGNPARPGGSCQPGKSIRVKLVLDSNQPRVSIMSVWEARGIYDGFVL